MISVTDFPDFQSAIDCAAAAGGGTVFVPPGIHHLSMTTLRDHVELYLAPGAELRSTLLPVPDAQSKAVEPTCNSHRYLLGGVDIRHAAITGFGVINGCGADHFWRIDPAKEYPVFGQRWWPQLHRPKGLIHFRRCQDITISGVTILNPPCYAVWLLGCERVAISRVTIDSPLQSPNTDGLDIDCCSDVRISGCAISTGDDAIAIKSDIFELGYDHPCENITVSNCNLKSSSCGIRLGYEGDGAIRNCIFSGCVIRDTMIGISLMSVIDPENTRGTLIFKGPQITDVIFADLVIDALQTFNFQHLKCAKGCLQGRIDRIIVRNILASARRGSYIGGLPEQPIGRLNFSGVFMRLSGPMGDDFLKQVPEPYPVWNDLASCGLPWAYFARHVQNLNFQSCEVLMDHDASGCWQPEALKTVDVPACHGAIAIGKGFEQ